MLFLREREKKKRKVGRSLSFFIAPFLGSVSMASVAYNFMVVDPNAHSRRYSDHNSTSHDPRRASQVVVDISSEAPSTTISKRRRSRKKSAVAVAAKERVSVEVC